MSSSSFNDSLHQLGGDSATAPNQPIDDGYVEVGDSPIQVSNQFTTHPIADSPSPAPIHVSAADQPELSSFHSEENGTPFVEVEYAAAGPVLPEMPPEEGLALKEWRRQNALRLEEKEKIEKELVSQILEEADEYKTNFHNKRKVVCESNKASNREREKVYLAGRDKFHADADKTYWKSIAELIPNEVPVIEKKGKKDEDKKPSIFVIQGPKPGKPTDRSRMRQILVKLKHDTPLHLKHSPPPPPAKEGKVDAAAAATTTTTAAPVAVA